MAESEHKGQRLLAIYDRLLHGEVLTKEALAQAYGVTAKSIQRDIEELRIFLAETELKADRATIRYNRGKKGYELVHSSYEHLGKKEILVLAKILLESRAFEKGELSTILEKLLAECPQEDRKVVEDIVKNENFCYVPLKHGKKLLDRLWDLSLFIRGKEIIRFTYTRQDGTKKDHRVKPVAVMFSEFYFYLVAYREEEAEYPTIFRVDRLEEMEGTGEKFHIPYAERFKDGEFRKRVQFMYPGPLRRVKFIYSGPSVEAVLDRLPTAQILEEKDGAYTIIAEAYGIGIDMWLGSQGDKVKVMQ